MSNKVGSACERCMHYVDFGHGGICAYNGQCYGTQTRRTGRIWSVDGKVDGQGRVHLPRKLAKQIGVDFGDTVQFEKRDGEKFIRIYKGE